MRSHVAVFVVYAVVLCAAAGVGALLLARIVHRIVHSL